MWTLVCPQAQEKISYIKKETEKYPKELDSTTELARMPLFLTVIEFRLAEPLHNFESCIMVLMQAWCFLLCM